MYDALRYISKYYTVTIDSAAFDTLQAPIPQYYSILYLYTRRTLGAFEHA